MKSGSNLDRFSNHLETIIKEVSALQVYLQTSDAEEAKPRTASAFHFHTDYDDAEAVGPTQSTATRYQRKPALPTAHRVRQMLEHRKRRQRHFWGDLFGEPAWDMILDLALAHIENRRVSVTSLCIASGVASTTALRWINMLIDEGLFRRQDDELDRRRAFVSLTDASLLAVAKYFDDISNEPF